MILSKLFNRKTYDDEYLKSKLKEYILNKRKDKVNIDTEFISFLASDYEIIELPNDNLSLLEIDGFHLFKVNDSSYSIGYFSIKNSVIEHLLITTDFINYYRIDNTSALISQLIFIPVTSVYSLYSNISCFTFIAYLPDQIIDTIVDKLFVTYKLRLSQVKMNPIKFIRYFISDMENSIQFAIKRITRGLNYYYIRCGENIWLLKGR